MLSENLWGSELVLVEFSSEGKCYYRYLTWISTDETGGLESPSCL